MASTQPQLCTFIAPKERARETYNQHLLINFYSYARRAQVKSAARCIYCISLAAARVKLYHMHAAC